MDQLSPNILPDGGFAPAQGSAFSDDVQPYPVRPLHSSEPRGSADGALAAADTSASGAATSAGPAPVSADDWMRNELIQAEMAAVMAFVANDFFSRQILPEESAANVAIAPVHRAEQRLECASGLNFATLAQRHRQEFFLDRREATPAIEASTAAIEPADVAEPPADWFVDPELGDSAVEEHTQPTLEAGPCEPSVPAQPTEPALVDEPAQAWPSNVIAFPIARRVR